MRISNKISVMVFMPVGVCGCSQTGFLGRIYDAVKKYHESVDYHEHSAESDVAKRYRVGSRGVVVGSTSLGVNPTTAKIEEAIVRELEKLEVKATQLDVLDKVGGHF